MVSRHNTSIGLPEGLERAGAYFLLFITGILLLMFEKNPTVRHHARQSIIASITIFAPLFVLWLFFNFVGSFLGLIPLLGGLGHGFFWLLAELTYYISFFTWLFLMLRAGFSNQKFMIPGATQLKKLM
jgi:uncharacterized membrane protein